MRLAPYARVAYLMGDKTPAELAGSQFFGLDLSFQCPAKNPDWIGRPAAKTDSQRMDSE
jgi:glycerophosphoryl diester phosphodiesterase